ncbi:MAG: hypothetical protein AAF125_26945 [Chloroflexota bacterium]
MCENGQHCSTIPAHPRYHRIAHGTYEKALRDAFWCGVWKRLVGADNHLIAFAEARRHIQKSKHYNCGLMVVPVDRIVGSSGRFRDFDSSFLPTRRTEDDRWVNVVQSHFEGITLPPVKLYQLDDAFYVEDGNHRVSVARLLGETAIMANVVVIEG